MIRELKRQNSFYLYIATIHGKGYKIPRVLVQNNLIQFNNVNVTDRNLISHQCLEKLYWEYISSSKGSNLLNFGLELEMGKDIPNYINGSGFVKMGDDLINYKII